MCMPRAQNACDVGEQVESAEGIPGGADRRDARISVRDIERGAESFAPTTVNLISGLFCGFGLIAIISLFSASARTSSGP